MSEEKYFLSGEAVTREELNDLLTASPKWLKSEEEKNTFTHIDTTVHLRENCVMITVDNHKRVHNFMLSYEQVRKRGEHLCILLSHGAEMGIEI